MAQKFVHVGKIHSPQGIRGEIFVYIFSKEAAWSDQWKELHTSTPDQKKPTQNYSIEKLKSHHKQKKPGFVLKLKEIKDRNQSEAIVGAKVYVPEEFLTTEEGEGIFLREVLNFEVVDKERGSIGKVVGFLDNGMQDLLVVRDSSGNEFEIPFVEPILIEIQRRESQILMELPFGLIPGEEI